jgi:hypothetical protein
LRQSCFSKAPAARAAGNLSSFAGIDVQDRQGSKEHSAKIFRERVPSRRDGCGREPRDTARDALRYTRESARRRPELQASTRFARSWLLSVPAQPGVPAQSARRARSSAGPRVAPLGTLSATDSIRMHAPYQVTNCIASASAIEYVSKSARRAPLGGCSRSTNKRAASRSFPFRDPFPGATTSLLPRLNPGIVVDPADRGVLAARPGDDAPARARSGQG